MEIISVKEKEFKEYGKVIEGLDVAQLLQKMQKTPLPDDVIYEPSDASLEALEVCEVLRRSVYGGLPVQIGYCNGHNEKLNGLEYHRSSEINIAVTDMILLLGKQQDIESDDTYDTAKVKAFFVPAGTVIEVYATTLHYAPCGVDKKGFRCERHNFNNVYAPGTTGFTKIPSSFASSNSLRSFFPEKEMTVSSSTSGTI